MNKIPLYVVYDKKSLVSFEYGFSLEEMKDYASKRKNADVGVILIEEHHLDTYKKIIGEL